MDTSVNVDMKGSGFLEFHQYHRTGNLQRRRRGVFYVWMNPISRTAIIGHSLCRIKKDAFNAAEGLRIAMNRTIRTMLRMENEKTVNIVSTPVISVARGDEPDYGSAWKIIHNTTIPDSMLDSLEDVKNRICRIIANIEKKNIEEAAAEHASDSPLTVKETEEDDTPF